ncbi:hypothetical protein AB5I41_21805 [Sphingomonas sp. MMS24-JH45]
MVMVNFYPAFVSTKWRAWDRARSDCARGAGVSADVYDRRARPAAGVGEDPSRACGHGGRRREPCRTCRQDCGEGRGGPGRRFRRDQRHGADRAEGRRGLSALFAELARRGWSDADLSALAQGNVLRVMERVEAVARDMAATPPVLVPTTVR